MRKIILFIFSFLLLITPLKATELGHNSDGYERNESNNYGVNKKWKINDSNIDNVKRTPYVNAKEKIFDFADILSSDDEKNINELINGFIKETGLDFVFVSIDMPYSSDSENDEYAYDFYDYNDFGINNENYGGIIIVRNKNESDPYYVASLFGEAQLYCNETRLDYLLDDIYDSFKNGDYKAGVSLFIHRFISYYNEGYDENKYYIDENGSLKEKYSLPYLTSLISGGFVSLLSVLGLVKKNKTVTKASNANDYLVKSSIEYLDKKDNFISTITTHHVISTSSSGGGGSHSGFGSSGGGHISGGRHG